MTDTQPIGIDLGTTNSAVAIIDSAGRTAMLPNALGDVLTPSAVLFDDNEIVVGKEARKAAVHASDRVALDVKRDVGKPVYSKPIRGRQIPPEVIQSCILRQLYNDARKLRGNNLSAVVTVPAYFDEVRRTATAHAAEMAELNLLDIVNEPTAAALAYAEHQGFLTPSGAPTQAMKVLVYDLGGGTFDVTLVDITPTLIRTIATDGDYQLGGCDWDSRLLDHVASEFQIAYNIDPRLNPAARNRLLETVIEAKHTLRKRQRLIYRK